MEPSLGNELELLVRATQCSYSVGHSPGQNTGVGSLSPLQGNLPNPEIEPRSPELQANSLPAEPQGTLLALKNLNSLTLA